ncbi:MAG: TRAP transporter large permease subunit [Proteobacteria bacterium]|nr:TRAP transporter large permease subunit [Pseudomonadota bacterium]
MMKKLSILMTSVPLALLLIGIVLCATMENLHSTMLDIGEKQWSGYSELRQPAEKPDCDPNAAPQAAPAQADEDDALLDDLFGEEEETVSEEAVAAARAVCLEKIQKYENIVARQNDGSLKTFVSIERAVSNIASESVAFGKHFLILIFIFCGLAATLQRQHLGLRTPMSTRDDRASQIAQLIGNLIVMFSFLAYYRQDLQSGVDNVSDLPIYWMVGFGLMALTNAWLIYKPLKPELAAEGTATDIKPAVSSENQITNKSESNSNLENKSESAAKSESQTEADAKSESQSEADVKSESQTEADAKPESQTEADAKSESQTEADAKPESTAESDKKTNKDAGKTPKPKNTIGQMLLGIPLYAYMAWICGFYFAFIENHFAGVGIYLNQMTEHADLYTNVALYVFAGMMLKYTDIADKFMALLRPWKFSPELLVFILVLASAIPTAYSGASGIFVIAAGAIIFRELKHAGARDSLAIAGTAMSGSMGIVLSPCLLVVIIAALNKDVTTTELFSAGFSIFCVNIFVFAIAIFTMKKQRVSCANPLIAFPAMCKAVVPVLPYIAIAAAVLLAFRYGLGAAFDEYSAPVLLPLVLIVLLIYDRIIAKRTWKKLQASSDEAKKAETPEPDGIIKSLLNAVNSTSIHAGGLLSLMTLSICIGGIIDRAHLNELLPQTFSSPILAMAVLFVILVIIGMIMDPYGAVILVSATLTQIAAANGIGAVHFWMTVLCAFELGYLTPPVALNQLLTRQVVGEKAYEYENSPDRPKNFWWRHERIMLPVAVKGLVLLLVAFMPLIINIIRWKMR